MRYVKLPKLPGHISHQQKRRLRRFWKELHNPHSPIVVLLGLPPPKSTLARLPRARRWRTP